MSVTNQNFVNQYNGDLENLGKDQLLRLALAQGFQSDQANKALGGAQFSLTVRTAANADVVTQGLVQVRTALDPQSSPTNFITKTFAPLDVTSTFKTRKITWRFWARTYASGFASAPSAISNVMEVVTRVVNAATPTLTNTATLGAIATDVGAGATFVPTGAAGQLNLVLTPPTAAANYEWTILVFVEDLQ